MKYAVKTYFAVFQSLLTRIIATDNRGNSFSLEQAVEEALDLIRIQPRREKTLFFIGNGASASIASHMATDFWKNARIRALSFNDSALLTCVSNDYGYSHVFEKPLLAFAKAGDILFAISSSGESENILRAVLAAKKKGLAVITFSGFSVNNPLRRMGRINFYVPATEYGWVEAAHLVLCHCLVDLLVKNKRKR